VRELSPLRSTGKQIPVLSFSNLLNCPFKREIIGVVPLSSLIVREERSCRPIYTSYKEHANSAAAYLHNIFITSP
jgi:hypothetical protein